MGLMEKWARWCVERWKTAIGVAGVITIIAAIGLALLRFDLTFYSIMPKNSRATTDLAEIIESFPSASSIVVEMGFSTKTCLPASNDALIIG